MNLCDAEENKKYTIIRIIGAYRNRLSELGFSPGCDIYMHKMDKEKLKQNVFLSLLQHPKYKIQ